MINRYLKTILENGITAIQNDLTILDELFRYNFILEDSESISCKSYFSTNGFTVVNGYPRSDSKFPLCAITLLSDREADYVLNNDAGVIDDVPEQYTNMDLKTTIWEYMYQLFIYTEHPDITAYYYEIVKSILLENIDTFNDLACFNLSLFGSELAPDLRYLPEHLFSRQLTFRCNSEFTRFDRDSKLAKAFKVTGIYVDKTASKQDIGDVKANVNIYEDIND
jgi:hypothetical protein